MFIEGKIKNKSKFYQTGSGLFLLQYLKMPPRPDPDKRERMDGWNLKMQYFTNSTFFSFFIVPFLSSSFAFFLLFSICTLLPSLCLTISTTPSLLLLSLACNFQEELRWSRSCPSQGSQRQMSPGGHLFLWGAPHLAFLPHRGGRKERGGEKGLDWRKIQRHKENSGCLEAQGRESTTYWWTVFQVIDCSSYFGSETICRLD